MSLSKAHHPEICSVCHYHVKSGIFCDLCEHWIQPSCNHLSKYDFQLLRKSKPKEPWYCFPCTAKVLPFINFKPDSTENNKQSPNENIVNLKDFFLKLNAIDKNISDKEDDVNENEISFPVNCKYYDTDEFNSLTLNRNKKNNSKSLKTMHMNLSSLTKHHHDLENLLSTLNTSFDIIGITETRFAKNSQPHINFDLTNYNFEHTPTETGAGGTLLYISDDITYKCRNDLNKLLYSPGELESTFIEIMNTKKKIIVGCIYRHPKMPIPYFNNCFLSPMLEKIGNENKEVMLLGDFNIDLLKVNQEKSNDNFLDILGSHMFLPQIILPTRVCEKSQTLIDNIFINSCNYNCISGNLTVKISDHLIQFLIMESIKPNLKPSENKYKRNWKKFDEDNFIKEFESIKWNEVLNLDSKDTNKSFNTFFRIFNNILDKHLPLEKISKSQQKKGNRKPWISNGILASMKKRDSFLNKSIKSKSDEQKKHFYSEYKLYRNMIVKLCRKSKKDHYVNFFNDNVNNIKNTWKGVNSIISSSKSKSNSPNSIIINKQIITDKETISNSFNEYFSSIATKLREAMPKSNIDFNKYLGASNPNSLFLSPVTPKEIEDEISLLDNNKSSGINSISPIILKKLKPKISIPLSSLFNLSFETGIFPEILKYAKIIPVYKLKGSILDVQNYRPISLLSNIDKLFEKIMHYRVSRFLETCQCIYPLQFGFRKKHSTAHALLNIIELIKSALDQSKFACGIFVDFSKAFDTVDHQILLQKLSHYGIRGVGNKWFESYLSGRKQFVTIDKTDSQLKDVIYGVPQGSVLGPLLFLIYINDLHKAIKYSIVHHFADDTNLLYTNKSLNSIHKKMKIDIKLLVQWLLANKISLNAGKTEVIIFRHHLKKVNMRFILKINGKKIYPSRMVKYLGVILDENLSWEPHINYLSLKLRKANGALSKVRHYIPKKTLRSLYFSLFHCHLIYAPQLWAQLENVHSNKIFLLQKKALRIMSNSDRRAHTNPLFHDYKILKLFDHVKMENALFLHKYFNNELPQSLIENLKIEKRNDPYSTRTSKYNTLIIPNINTKTYGESSVINQSIKSWHYFSYNFQNPDLQNITVFKLKEMIQNFILDSYQ